MTLILNICNKKEGVFYSDSKTVYGEVSCNLRNKQKVIQNENYHGIIGGVGHSNFISGCTNLVDNIQEESLDAFILKLYNNINKKRDEKDAEFTKYVKNDIRKRTKLIDEKSKEKFMELELKKALNDYKKIITLKNF